jgi:LysR family transcriptional regulator, glycine cleavage system transcriptional activator
MTKPLPPLNAVRAFEAASRHLNLSRAAEELGVTQGAISKQVIALEDFIGVQLFLREPGGLQLTHEGGNLKEAIAPAFSTLAEAFARYSRRAPRSNSIRISTVASFASQFLVPRLSRFKERFPACELEFLTSIRLVDLAREEFDIAVRYGPGGWEGVQSEPLSTGTLVPVCAPAVLERAGGNLDRVLADNRRIQSAASNEWRHWAEAAGIDLARVTPTYIMEEFTVAISGALAGEGLALSPDILVIDRIRRGELVQFSPVTVRTGYCYHVVHTTAALRRPFVPQVIAWLREEAAFAP